MAKNNMDKPVQSAYRQRLSEMLDLTYELEGLLHIGITRSMVPARLNHLIVNKLNAIVALADAPAAPVAESPAVESPDAMPASVNTPPVAGDDVPPVGPADVDSDESQIIGDVTDKVVDDNPTEINVDIEESQSMTESDAMSYNTEDYDSTYDEYDESDDDTVIVYKDDSYVAKPEYVAHKIKEERKEEIKEGWKEEGKEELKEGWKEERKEEIKEERKVESMVGEKPVKNHTQNAAPLFSINDRFLYTRELFKGNLKHFDEAMNTLITLDSQDEAEEYFISEWNFNPENPVVEDFFNKIKSLF